jgi:hypothetical protein
MNPETAEENNNATEDISAGIYYGRWVRTER